MIGEEEFKSQLYDIYESGSLQVLSNCNYIEFTSKENENTNEGLSQALKAQFIISSNMDLETSRISTKRCHGDKNPADENIIVEILIRYETVFQEPQLCFRLWDQVEESSSDSIRLNFGLIDRLKDDSRLPGWFILNIDLIDNEPWFIVGVCDTENIIGNLLLDYKNRYMERWVSVYMISWLTQV